MSDDLIKRLPDNSLIERLLQTDKTKHGYYGYVPYNRDGKEAADRIAALETQLQSVLDRESATQARHDAKLDALDAELASAKAATVAEAARVQHIKRGSTYSVIGKGQIQTDLPLKDYDNVVVYQGDADGLIWVRPVSEFEDGRFAAITEASHD